LILEPTIHPENNKTGLGAVGIKIPHLSFAYWTCKIRYFKEDGPLSACLIQVQVHMEESKMLKDRVAALESAANDSVAWVPPKHRCHLYHAGLTESMLDCITTGP
jgi:hypothetical protein